MGHHCNVMALLETKCELAVQLSQGTSLAMLVDTIRVCQGESITQDDNLF